MSESAELIVLDEVSPAEIYQGEGMAELLERINVEARSLVPVTSTAKGRKEIASIASKVSKCKTYLDARGKEIVDELKKQPKVIDGKRKEMRDFLDNLKTEVRAPLTEWEKAEEDRVLAHTNDIADIVNIGSIARENWHSTSLKDLKEALESLNGVDIGVEFEEFESVAEESIGTAISDVEYAIGMRTAEDERNAELEELRTLKAEQEQKDRDEQIRRDAAEKSERDAAEAIEAGKRAKEAAEKRAIEAEENTRRQVLQAEERTKRETEEKAAKEKAELEAREADTKHRGKINRAAATSLETIGLSKEDAKSVITAIAKGMIPNVKVNY